MSLSAYVDLFKSAIPQAPESEMSRLEVVVAFVVISRRKEADVPTLSFQLATADAPFICWDTCARGLCRGAMGLLYSLYLRKDDMYNVHVALVSEISTPIDCIFNS